jgi:phasin family protein
MLQCNKKPSEEQMATKKSTNHSAEPIDTALASGAEAMKEGFEKAVKGYDQFVAFGKDNAEAVLKSANLAGKGIESMNSEAFAYARKSAEESVAATKAVLSSKTIEEAFQLQSEFSKAVFETYVDQLAKFGDMALAAARHAAEPLQARATAFADLVRVA